MITDSPDFDDRPARVLPSPSNIKAERNRLNGVHHHEESFESARPVPSEHAIYSLEAEENLLSSVFVDPPDVLGRCVAAGVQPAAFTDPKHATVYRCLLQLHAQGVEINPAVLAVELRARGDLDRIGGFPFILQVSNAGATTAQVSFFIDRVMDLARRRELLRLANRLSSGAANPAEDVAELTDQVLAGLKPAGRKVTVPSRPLPDFQYPHPHDTSTLLGNRYLSRGDGAILSGTSGIGKSSLTLLLAVLWALGRPALGIEPSGPLRSLIIQSEDSDGDVAEVWQSIVHSLNLTPSEITQVRSMVLVVSDRTSRGLAFHRKLKDHIAAFTPDMVWINPLQAFLDGDITASQDLGRFLREQLNSLNDPPRFAYVLIHHTTKPATGKDRAERLWHEVMYDMAGGAELINWARAILSLRPAAAEGDFNLVLAKRGRRAGLTKEIIEGLIPRTEPRTVIGLRHAKGTMPVPGHAKPVPVLMWEERPADVAPDEPKEPKGGRPTKYEYNDYRTLMPAKSSPGLPVAQLYNRLIPNGAIEKKNLHNLLKRWQEEGFIETVDVHGQPRHWRAVI